MQVQSISNQSFGAVRISPEVVKGTSAVERLAIGRLAEKHAKNPVDVVLTRSKDNKLMGYVTHKYSTVPLILTEDSYNLSANSKRKITPYSLLTKLCGKADIINKNKMCEEDIIRMASKAEK